MIAVVINKLEVRWGEEAEHKMEINRKIKEIVVAWS